MSKYNYMVITKVPEEPNMGNLAMGGFHIYAETEPPTVENNFTGKYESMTDLLGHRMLGIREPVFALGEILVSIDGEREILGSGRKPSKWSVEYDVFSDIEEAVERAKEVQSL